MSDVNNAELIQWKTNAWQNPDMVAWYSGRMVENSSTNHLKNTVEIGIIRSYVTGHDVIDIGTGTGRAALPLVRDGYAVTGVDSSQAMLDETRRLADGMPITLKKADIQKLSFKDAAFDCAVSLNVLVHFPNWREALLEWGRVIRPNGRIIFDIHSKDHVMSAYGDCTEQWPDALNKSNDPNDFGSYMARLSADEIIDFANEQGFVVKALVPYGAFLGGGNINWLLYPYLDRKNSWRRVLSWFAVDSDLNALGEFIENDIIAHLTPKATGRLFVVLEKRKGISENEELRAKLFKLDMLIEHRLVSELMLFLPYEKEYYQNKFLDLLKPLRSKRFFLLFMDSIFSRFGECDFLALLGPSVSKELLSWRQCRALDEQCVSIVEKVCTEKDLPIVCGVEMTASLPYSLMGELLTKFYKKFTGMRA
ncbi:class I SAM-dependent methyltransferase [Janthinobacterium sp. B9-8]|uniref:class I SAM-dependent methyltransferase n=1 Tax=Janthinobacterium sp. B9-8 TaxID=1236179 RepID=UPI000AC9DB3F|nr:methyltransferase domain-containing protein [Janthinobacterium sp. B9-8]